MAQESLMYGAGDKPECGRLALSQEALPGWPSACREECDTAAWGQMQWRTPVFSECSS